MKTNQTQTQEFYKTVEYLQEDENGAISAWRDTLADVISIVISSGEHKGQKLAIAEDLFNLRDILNGLRAIND